MMPVHYDTKRPWKILLQFHGSIWLDVLPYCVLNCGITFLAYFLTAHDNRLTFSPQGHALMSLIVSYLVVSKVFLSLERYMTSRTWAGQALTMLRELNQLVLTFTEETHAIEARIWKREATEQIVELLNSTIRVVRDDEKACYLARNEPPPTNDDPMVYAQTLRSHLYHGSNILSPPMHILEKVKLVDHLNLYLNAYRELLKLASTPLPFIVIQMGRTFLFLWVFTMPFALLGIIEESYSVFVFVFFLTYGFIGLEFVSMQLLHPFGDSPSDINIVGMGEAVVAGMERDARQVELLYPKVVKLPSSSNNKDEDVYAGPEQPQSTMSSDQDAAAHAYSAFP